MSLTVKLPGMTSEPTTEEFVDLLCLADEALMLSHGCFPLDRTNEKERLLNDAAHAIRRVTSLMGGDHREIARRAEKSRQRFPGRTGR